jgi:hypothetical protein
LRKIVSVVLERAVCEPVAVKAVTATLSLDPTSLPRSV